MNEENPESNNLSINWGNKTMLIAEDDSFMLLKTLLKKTNINIIQAKTGIEVLKILNDNNTIDIILMDIQMPEMNGLEATKKIKSSRQDIPIIAQTAFALSSERQRCEEAGCDNYITKPINSVKLIRILASYLEH